LETTATLSLGLISETAIAARNAAPPPPTKRTSCEDVSTYVSDLGLRHRMTVDTTGAVDVDKVVARFEPYGTVEGAASRSAANGDGELPHDTLQAGTEQELSAALAGAAGVDLHACGRIERELRDR